MWTYKKIFKTKQIKWIQRIEKIFWKNTRKEVDVGVPATTVPHINDGKNNKTYWYHRTIGVRDKRIVKEMVKSCRKDAP
jgi:hypothetical protein